MTDTSYSYYPINNEKSDMPLTDFNHQASSKAQENDIESSLKVNGNGQKLVNNFSPITPKVTEGKATDPVSDDKGRKKAFMGASFYTNESKNNSDDFSKSVLAPLARLEAMDEKDDREVVSEPYPGVDDGFFTENGLENSADENPDLDPDVEFIPTQPKDPEPTYDDYPLIPRAGEDDDKDNKNPDENDGFSPPVSKDAPHPFWPKFPVAPGYGFDVENGVGLGSGVGETIPDLNVYQHKKTLAQGMMDLALFSANANQLRYVLETFRNHPYFYPSLVLISISLFLQVAVGIGLIWNATYNVKNEADLCRANKINNFTVIAIFLVTIINVFISAFGVSPAPS